MKEAKQIHDLKMSQIEINMWKQLLAIVWVLQTNNILLIFSMNILYKEHNLQQGYSWDEFNKLLKNKT